jgi:pimeloyl-ACP methyl ester carboxylesterase
MMRLNMPTFIVIISVSIGVITFSVSAFGQCAEYDYYWVAGAGDWSTPDNWRHEKWNPDLQECVLVPGVPTDGNYVHIGAGEPYVSVPGVTCYELDIDSCLNIVTGGSLSCRSANIGSFGAGIIKQTGGTNSVGYFDMGRYLSSSGTYELSDGILSAAMFEVVGCEGTGLFRQTGGTNIIFASLCLGQYPTGSGTYYLSDGDLSANNESIGYRGSGAFVQNGGTNTIESTLNVGGRYELLGGTLNVQVNVDVDGFFVVNGGVINGGGPNAAIGVVSGGSLTGPGTFNIIVVYESDRFDGPGFYYGSVGIVFERNCLTKGGAYNVKQLTPADFAGGNVPNLLESSVFDVSFDGSFCGEFTITIPYDRSEVYALGVDEMSLVILHETGPGTYENLDDIMVHAEYPAVSAKAHTFGKFAVAYVPPVILLHGWRPALTPSGQVATWELLKTKLEAAGIPYYEFNYLPANGNPVEYAHRLQRFMDDIIADSNYAGKFDIICHSMGAMVSRYYMENLGGADKVRLWIGIAPVNQGAAITDNILLQALRFIIPRILRSFFPDFNLMDPAISHMQTDSDTIRKLNDNGISPNVVHKVIVGWNGANRKSFGGLYGETYAKKTEPTGHHHYWTNQGDGVVAIEQSRLPGNFGIDCVNDVNHNSILFSPTVFTRVIAYLNDPCEASLGNWPPQPDPCADIYVGAKDNQGNLPGGIQQSIPLLVDSSVQKATIIADWHGSDIDLQIISPSQQLLDPNAYPVVEYWKQDNAICYVIDSPTSGLWTARLIPVDIPPEGEPYSLAVFFASPLVLNLTTAEDTYNYPPGASATIVAQLTDANGSVTGATVTTKITKPDLSTEQLMLYDDATHGDTVPADGNYTNSYNLLTDGDYVVTAYATGTVGGNPFERIDIKTLYAALTLDFNYDDIVNFADFTYLAARWLDSNCSSLDRCGNTDLDMSGEVDIFDLRALADYWLEGTTP